MTAAEWRNVGAVAPERLVDARLQAHHAAQVVSAVGATLLDPQPDDSHPNLGWSDAHDALVSRRVGDDHEAQVALRVGALTLAVLDGKGRVEDELALDGRSLEEAYAWLEGALRARIGGLPDGGLRRGIYDIPDHAVARGAAFARGSGEAFEELARWLANGSAALGALADRMGEAEVRLWPHHFDIGLLSVVELDAAGSATRTIGAGLSPGDDSYPEPYWYVSPWPYPKSAADLPALSTGHWRTAGFTAAILTGSELVAGDTAVQAARADAFLDDAVAVSRRVLSL